MRAQAKRSSAANRDGSATRGSIVGTPDDAAPRAPSPSAAGSGAPSRRRPLALLVLALSAATLATALVVASAFADKEVIDYFGDTGSKGGEFSQPRDIAVNRTGAGPADAGDIYVADEFNHRVQRFDSQGNFISAWGADVALPDGGTDYEICTEAAECQQAAPSGGNGTAAGNGGLDNPQSVAVDGDTGDVYVSDRDNRRINIYDGEGAFIRSFGWDVAESGTGNTGTEYEICVQAEGDVCKAGVGSSTPGAGQFHTSTVAGAWGIAVSPPDGEAATGKVFLSNTGARRVETYDLDGANPANFGSSTEFGFNQPRKIAVDSRGVVYASDSNNGAEVKRYDTEDANGGGIGFLAAITAENSTPAGPLLPGSSTATAGLAVDPDSDEAGPDTDTLYVLRDPSSGNTRVQQLGESGLAAAPATVEDEHGEGAGFSFVNGLGLNDAAGRLFVSATTSVSGLGSGNRVYVIDDLLPPPVPTMDEITVKTDTTATFSGTVDPQGGHVSGCRFQYSTDQEAWTDLPEPDCPGLEPEGGPQAVSEDVGGLVANTTYYVRFEVSRTFVPGSEVTTPGVKVFATDSVPPVVTDVGSTQVADTSARLVGTIDPKNSPTGYVFEYGTTPALGQSTAPLAIGGGAEEITVSQVVAGLANDTDYYFRLLATNAFGTTASDQATLHTRATPLPNPANRAWEQVSPPDKNVGDVDSGVFLFGQRGLAAASPAGNDVGFCAQVLFGEPPGQMNGLCVPYFSKRTPGGWETITVPPYCGQSYPAGSPAFAYPSRDFSRVALVMPEFEGCPIPPLDPAAPIFAPGGLAGSDPKNFYREDLTTDPASFDLLAPEPTTALGGHTEIPAPLGSEDFSHVVYQVDDNQTPEPDSPPPGNFRKIYDWHEGALTLVSKDPSGEPFTTATTLPGDPFFKPFHSAVSADGERIYFQTGNIALGEANEIYLRENAITTFHVSASECEVECGGTGGDDEFRWATADGGKAFFSSTDKLTDAPVTGSRQLYRWDRDAPPGSRLTLLTADHEPADGANLHNLIGASEDGETAYFTTHGQLVSGEPTFPTSGGFGAQGLSGAKLYRWRWNEGNPRVDYLDRYDDFHDNLGTDGDFNGISGVQDMRHVTPDGEHLLIYTETRYLPAIDRDADGDIYRWSEAEGWLCVSCQLPGVPSTGEVDRNQGGFPHNQQMRSTEPTITMTDDGERIFFGTADALVPEDVNGEEGCPVSSRWSEEARQNFLRDCQDVYEWHDGRVNLLSTGTSPHPAWLIDIGPSGRDVFIMTKQQLVGWDKDDNTDIYNARIGGGFPEPPAQPPACEGEGCRGAATVVPAISGAGSAVFQGPGNPKATPPPRRCSGEKLRRGRRCVSPRAIARKRCRRLKGAAKRRCIRKQTSSRLRRAQRRAKRRQQRLNARRANANRRAQR